MKKCLSCHSLYSSSNTVCSECNTSIHSRDGVLLFAPDLALEGGGFKASYFADLAGLEAKHFWFRIRNRLIVGALKKYCPQFQSFIEIGCGTGFVLSGITQAFPNAKLCGSEVFTAGLSFASSRLTNVQLMQMDARNIPFVNEFDTIGAFDVIEHIEEDEAVLSQMHLALKAKGIMLLTVPQHAWLWSPVDNYACHVRRYSADELHRKVEKAGFEILRSTSFISVLLPAIGVSRLIKKNQASDNFDPTSELRISFWLNKVFELILGAEVFMILRGINFPIGSSRLLVARKL